MIIFDKMEKFAAYGFNKSHAAAYGYLSYVSAYLKAHYPKEWMAALMTCDSHDINKVARLIRECQNMEINILRPDVNESNKEFTATSNGIRFAMSGIKGVGEGVVDVIVKQRKKGNYKGLYDFIRRVDIKRVGKKTIENLIFSGCFDFTNWSRDAMKQSIEPMFGAAVKKQKEDEIGMMSLFSLLGTDETEDRL